VAHQTQAALVVAEGTLQTDQVAQARQIKATQEGQTLVVPLTQRLVAVVQAQWAQIVRPAPFLVLGVWVFSLP
jgi:prolyl-tRNA editing enzyme YbaK/EbsC (Cys-tRNA(Pro) deacylase)